jgi:hypothetical protein
MDPEMTMVVESVQAGSFCFGSANTLADVRGLSI